RRGIASCPRLRGRIRQTASRKNSNVSFDRDWATRLHACPPDQGSWMREDLKRQILRYLLLHTGARDSPEGIRVWWLDPECAATLPVVEEALEELVRLGWVEPRGDGDVHLFGLLADATDEIRQYLIQGSPRG